jgi:hypothetical protein
MIQGEDIQVRLTMTDGTNPIPPSSLNAYSVVVYYKETNKKTVLATYKSTNTGLFDIVVFNDVAGKIDIFLNRNITAKFPVGRIYAEVFIQETASSEFISSLANNGVNEIFIAEVYSSANGSVL